MSQLDQANTRLDAALERLESAVRARQAKDGDAGGDTATDAQLEQELARLREDFAALQNTSSTVSRRLDAAIGRLKAVLAE